VRSSSIYVLVPVFDDWEVLPKLLRALDATLRDRGVSAEVVVIDDGSTQEAPRSLEDEELCAIEGLRVVRLRRNLGHQRAITVGIAYIHEHLEPRPVVLMDSDGEDDPGEIPRLLDRYEALEGRKIVFAARKKRSETLLFQCFYRVYQVVHLFLTGRKIRIGNFSVIPPEKLATLSVTPEVWTHYAAAVLNSRIEHDEVDVDRVERMGGRSKMNFTSLVAHGLSALSVWSEIIGVRLLSAVAALTGLVGVIASIFLLRAIAAGSTRVEDIVVPSIALGGVLLQALVAAMLFVVLTIRGRQQPAYLPAREYANFVGDVFEVATSRELSHA